MDPNDLMAAIAQAGGGMGGGMMPPDPGMQEAGGPPDPMAAMMGGGGGEGDLMSLFAQQPGGQGSAPAAGGGGAAPAPKPAPTPVPGLDTPESMAILDKLTQSGLLNLDTGEVQGGLGGMSAINGIMRDLGGMQVVQQKFPWLLDLINAQKGGTALSSGLMDSLKGAYTTNAAGRKVTKGSGPAKVVPK